MLKSILVPTANGKPQTASSRLPFAVNAMLKVPINDSRELHVKRNSKGLQKGFKPKTSENVSGKTESN